MAFEVSKTGYQQIDPPFGGGYPYPNRYHNIGQLQTPYQGKKFGQGGDYGPPQRTRYYTDQNPTYPYVLDRDFHAGDYLPTEGCCFERPGYFPCYEDKYPEQFIPPDYFSPRIRFPSGHAQPIREFASRPFSGSVAAFAPNDVPISSSEFSDYPIRENYSNSSVLKRLRVAHNPLEDSKNFYPFVRRT